MSSPTFYADLLRNGRLVNMYQPIVDLQTNQTAGLEILTRLVRDDATLIQPGEFLPHLDHAALEFLFFTSLANARAEILAKRGDLFISINVSPTLMLQSRFLNRLTAAIDGLPPNCIVLEVLENEQFLSPDIGSRIARLREAGVCLAIDDLGKGYSSLTRLNQMRVDVIKLDMSFARHLKTHPESLHVISAVIYIARGWGCHLVVEGAETREIVDALRVLGVRRAQGFGIAMPMPAAAALAWLATVRPAIDPTPTSMLGAYAAHIGIVEACRAMLAQPLAVSFADNAADPHACPIGHFFDRNGLHEQPFGLAHKRFHKALRRYREDPAGWEAAAAELWTGLQDAIHAEDQAAAAAPATAGASGATALRVAAS